MERLPDELLFLIVRELDTARDVAHLGTCSRRLHRLVAAEGWRIFVQTRFPHRDYATADAWAWLAERLTYNARCWDRRSIIYDLIDVARTDVYHDVAGGMVRGEASGSAMARGRQRQGQTAAYQPIVDVGIDRSTGEQLVVWGAGENLVASRRPSSWTYRVKARPGSRGASEVAVSPGASFGYRPGVDDITGLVLCGKDDAGSGVPRYVAVGRASGDISLHSTEGSLAVVHRLSTGREEEEEAEEDESGERSEVRSLDSCGQMVAAGMREGAMFLYKLPGSDAPFVMQPTLQLSMEHDGQEMPRRQEYASIRCVKFVREDILAVGLIGQVSPLRYIRMAESRAVTEFAPRDNALSFYGPASTVKAIEPLCPSDSKLGNLVLSAWDDGTIR